MALCTPCSLSKCLGAQDEGWEPVRHLQDSLRPSGPETLEKSEASVWGKSKCREAPVRFGSVTVWGWKGSSSSGFRFWRFLCKRGLSVFQYSLTGRDASRFRFRFLENGSGGSGSTFGFRKNGSDGSGFRFRFGSWATLQMGALKWGLKVTLGNLRTIVHICGFLGPFLSGTFVAKWRQL